MPGAPVVIQVWGAHERCDLEAMKEIARPFLPPRPPDAPPDPDLSQPAVLRRLAREARTAVFGQFRNACKLDLVWPPSGGLGRV